MDPRFAALAQPGDVSVERLRQVLGTDAVLLEYVLDEQSPMVLAVTGRGVTARFLGVSLGELRERTRDLLAFIGRGRRTQVVEEPLLAQARALGEMLVGPVWEEVARARRIVVVPDDVLTRLPFAVLRVERNGREVWLGCAWALSRVSSAALLVEERRDGSGGRPGEGPVHIFCVPDPGESARVEYGVEGEDVPGSPADPADTGYSLSRDDQATDTDNSYVDFTSATPSPGVLVYSLPTFDIPLPAGAGWNFISFPLDASGSAADVLDDLGGDTTWDMVKWYNPLDPTDPWKTYNPSKPAWLNDLASIDDAMGIWLHLTANGGDMKLTTGLEGSYPGSATNIDLYTGWNLVGYPSATASLASSTLPAQAGMVAYHDSGSAYLTTDALPAAPGKLAPQRTRVRSEFRSLFRINSAPVSVRRGKPPPAGSNPVIIPEHPVASVDPADTPPQTLPSRQHNC